MPAIMELPGSTTHESPGPGFWCYPLVETNEIVCNSSVYHLVAKKLTYEDTWFWIYVGIYIFLALMAGLCSGLTLGLLSLDNMSLQIIQETGTERQQKQAARILPVLKQHHLLLVTLILTNAIAVTAMPLIFNELVGFIAALIVSVIVVLFIGEVIPQAICSRHGLAVGSALVPLVWVLMVLLFVVAYPIAAMLDCILGEEKTSFFGRSEIKALIDLHGPGTERPEDEDTETLSEAKLTIDEVSIIKGALELRDKTVSSAMVPIESVFMLEVNQKMDKETIQKIVLQSHSRIPIYEGSRQNVLSVLLVKQLLLKDLEEEIPLSAVMKDQRCMREVTYVTETTPMYDLLNDFETGKSHLCFVTREARFDLDLSMASTYSKFEANKRNNGEIIGIITLEDVLEELLQNQIVDETDVYVDVHRRIKVAKRASMMAKSYAKSIGELTDPEDQPGRLSRASSKSKIYSRSRGPSSTSIRNAISASEEKSDAQIIRSKDSHRTSQRTSDKTDESRTPLLQGDSYVAKYS